MRKYTFETDADRAKLMNPNVDLNGALGCRLVGCGNNVWMCGCLFCMNALSEFRRRKQSYMEWKRLPFFKRHSNHGKWLVMTAIIAPVIYWFIFYFCYHH